MKILGIECSCDECAVSVVEDGRSILSSVISTQIEEHKPFDGVVPEIAARLHTEKIISVYREAMQQSASSAQNISAIAVTAKPGLIGSLLVGLSFAKGLSFAWQKPLIGIDHILAHLYAPQLETDICYPHIGLLVSGGHTLLAIVHDYDQIEVLGTTVDDAVGEAFDKVAKYYNLGYPGGKIVDDLASDGDEQAFRFPSCRIEKEPYNVSYSGLKTAVIHQKKQFLYKNAENTLPNLCASFQKAAIDMLLDRVKKAVKQTGLQTVVAAGGVAANSYLRRALSAQKSWQVFYPSLALCTDNAAMIAGIGYQYLKDNKISGWDLNAESRVTRFKRRA